MTKNLTTYPVIRLNLKTAIPTNRDAFIANAEIKQSLIHILGQYIGEKLGIEVIHAEAKGDADIDIVSKTLHFASLGLNVIVSASDTDILVMLFHATMNMTIYMKRSNDELISIQEAKSALGEEMCKFILFAHSVSGCDTTSSM